MDIKKSIITRTGTTVKVEIFGKTKEFHFSNTQQAEFFVQTALRTHAKKGYSVVARVA